MAAPPDPDLRRQARRNLRIFLLVLIGLPILFFAGYVALWSLNPIR